jgi:hypothetical protein
VFFKFGVEVGVELSIVNALYRLRITDQLFKSYAFIRVVTSIDSPTPTSMPNLKKHPLYVFVFVLIENFLLNIRTLKTENQKSSNGIFKGCRSFYRQLFYRQPLYRQAVWPTPGLPTAILPTDFWPTKIKIPTLCKNNTLI